MDEGEGTSVSEIRDAFGERFDKVEADLIDIGYLDVTTVFDIDTLIQFAESVKVFFEEGFDEEAYDFEAFNELVYVLAGEMLLRAQAEGWGGKRLDGLYEYFELNG